MLLRYPVCIAWLNGHTHVNTITAHTRETGTGGFWEITTASCVDFPQQQQLIDLVDNRDGDAVVLRHGARPRGTATWTPGDLSQTGLASLSRELAANSWLSDPPRLAGSPLDRNVELLMPAPFELSAITDAAWRQSR